MRVEARSTGSRYSGDDHGARQPMAALSSGVCDPFFLQVLPGLSGGFMDLSRIGSDRAIDYPSSRAEPAGPRAEIAVAVMACISHLPRPPFPLLCGAIFCMANTVELVPVLLEAGVHFGHQTKRWNPKMKPFIFQQRNQIYIINLDETVKQLHRATEFLQEVARRGGKILFVGCKKQAQEAIKEAALACGQFYVNQRWLGGTLTNLATIRKSIGRLKYIEQIEQSPEFKKMGKQEIAALNRAAAKLRRNLNGILEMEQLPDALVVIDTLREQNAVNEARRLGIPVVAIVDTNADPEVIDYPIAGNDDAIRAIRVLLQKLVDAIVSASHDARVREEVEMAGVSA